MILADKQPLPGDWASRPAFRGVLPDGKRAILIETVPDAQAVQGHSLAEFARIAAYLRDRGFHVPHVFDVDPENGRLLVEDMGEKNWGAILPDQSDVFYPAAVDVLLQFKVQGKPAIDLPSFENSYIYGRTVWFLEDYKGVKDTQQKRDFIQIWDDLMLRLQDQKRVFVHGDYHPRNMMPLPDNRIGLLDFAAAMEGPGLYDLVNLLEDIRRDVPDETKAAMKVRYGADEEAYAILHAQFYCRLLGQMTKRGMDVPKTLDIGLRGLVHRFGVLSPLKNLVLS